MTAQPCVDLVFSLGLSIPIALLQDAGQFFGFAAQTCEVVVLEFAPLLSYLSLEFMPFSKHDILSSFHMRFSLSYDLPGRSLYMSFVLH